MNENKYLQQFFNKKYADSIGDSNFYIAFEDCGFHISKETFNDPTTQQYSKNVQVEQLSNDCDYIVPVCDTILSHSASTISNYVELLKDTIHFNDGKFTDNLEDMMALFGNAKSQLASQFVSSASTIDPRSSFYLSNLNPSGFLDDDNPGMWTPYSESWSFPSTSTGTGGHSQPPTGIWKIRPDLLKAIKTSRSFPIKVSPDRPDDNLHIRRMPLTRVQPVAAQPAPSHEAMMARVSMPAATPAAAATPMATTASTTMIRPAILATAASGNDPKTVNSHLLINKSILAQRFLVTNDPGKTDDKPVTTSTVDINFKYCIVNIDRPWLYKNILDINQTWYCTGLTEGFFSTGEASADNNGKLPSLPVSMILIKDLSISATFNAGDWENAKNAVALDSLNIAEADFKDLGNNKHLIQSAGVQIIGWICEYLPKFPVCSDPNLATA